MCVKKVAEKCGVGSQNVTNTIIWGNHSSTQFPDVTHATVCKGSCTVKAKEAINDEAWVNGPFISVSDVTNPYVPPKIIQVFALFLSTFEMIENVLKL